MLRDHLGERLAEVLLDRGRVELGQRVVHAHVAQLAVPEADPDGGRDEERVEEGERLARLPV